MVRTQIQLTDSQATALRKMASARGVSVAELVRQGVDGLLYTGPATDADERRRRALSIVGRFRSGKRDTSRKHDRALAEAVGR
jgi:CO dehydrogenase/acetyl-CoA synthase epsilon subunit